MPHGTTNKKNASGAGTIRKKVVQRNGKAYTYWEARYTVGFDPGTGKQKQRSITGKTQKEVREKLQAVAVSITDGTYIEPTKLTVGQWLDQWLADYLKNVKPRTVEGYTPNCNIHIKPAIGAVRLNKLTPMAIQRFYNGLKNSVTGEVLSSKTKKNIHGTLHRALETAVRQGIIAKNPADNAELPKIQRKEIKPLDEDEIKRFMQTIKGHKYERIYLITLFTGLREGEILGLTWDCVDFSGRQILVKQQLQKARGQGAAYSLLPTKNGKSRRLTCAKFVMDLLEAQRVQQQHYKAEAGASWQSEWDLVFTNELGGNLCAQTVYLHFKKLAEQAGIPTARFHDLRHSYAVAALRAGDDIKTVQENLGHHTAAFTLDTYAHVTERMKLDSADRMDRFISAVSENRAS